MLTPKKIQKKARDAKRQYGTRVTELGTTTRTPGGVSHRIATPADRSTDSAKGTRRWPGKYNANAPVDFEEFVPPEGSGVIAGPRTVGGENQMDNMISVDGIEIGNYFRGIQYKDKINHETNFISTAKPTIMKTKPVSMTDSFTSIDFINLLMEGKSLEAEQMFKQMIDSEVDSHMEELAQNMIESMSVKNKS